MAETATPQKPARAQKSTAPLSDAAFDWQDPLDLEGELSEDERMVRDTARAYAQDKLFPRVLTAYREERFDREVVNEMGHSACSAPPSPRNTAAPASATSATG